MKRILVIAAIALMSRLADANHVKIIYPRDNQTIASIDSEFVFGNTTPGAVLRINGAKVPVHRGGGFLAFIPVNRGPNSIKAVSIVNGDTAIAEININVGQITDFSASPFIRNSMNPSGRTVLTGSDELEFGVKIKRSGQGYCRFKDSQQWLPLNIISNTLSEENAFGAMAIFSDSISPADCIGYLPMKDIKDSSRIYLLYLDKSDSCFGDPHGLDPTDSSDFFVVKSTPTESRVVTIIERPRVVRLAPAKGYLLVNQPPGVRFAYAGETPDYYRVQLAENYYGYVKKTDSKLSPPNIAKPQGEVSTIIANDFPDRVEISMAFGDKLPFRISEQGDILTVDIYGLRSNVDWIRQNGTQKYIRQIWWTQVQKDIFRLHLRWHSEQFWGYNGRYDNVKFTLVVKKKPKIGAKNRPLDGLRIMLDAGHSKDSGAVGPTGFAEKDANLLIARQLKSILESRGAEVLMTRTGNEDVPLVNRPDTILKENVDLSVSIHNNALPDGINPFKNNGTSAYYYFPQSRPLAEKIHQRMLSATKLPDHGLYYGNLALTRIENCPAVLIECAFMMIPEQEDKLKSSDFRRTIAKAIADGIGDFVK
jgi:N-acetylmuramoyl-L-alanine amidase